MDGKDGKCGGRKGPSCFVCPFRPFRLLRPFRPAMKIAVIGAAGYVSGELLRLWLQQPEAPECVAPSRSQAGKPIADIRPALGGLSDARFSGASAAEVSRGRDVVFLSLEHGESSKVAGDVFDAGPSLVVD